MSFNVIRHHRWWFVISSILVIISLISIFTKNFIYMGGTANVEMSKFMKWFVSLLQREMGYTQMSKKDKEQIYLKTVKQKK